MGKKLRMPWDKHIERGQEARAKLEELHGRFFGGSVDTKSIKRSVYGYKTESYRSLRAKHYKKAIDIIESHLDKGGNEEDLRASIESALNEIENEDPEQEQSERNMLLEEIDRHLQANQFVPTNHRDIAKKIKYGEPEPESVDTGPNKWALAASAKEQGRQEMLAEMQAQNYVPEEENFNEEGFSSQLLEKIANERVQEAELAEAVEDILTKRRNKNRQQKRSTAEA